VVTAGAGVPLDDAAEAPLNAMAAPTAAAPPMPASTRSMVLEDFYLSLRGYIRSLSRTPPTRRSATYL
jgi:hypothetical protein